VTATVAVATGAIAGLVSVGCSGDDGDRPEVGLQATLQSSTLFETRRALRLGLSVDAGTERDVRIGAVQLRSPLFEPVEPDVRDTVLGPESPARVFPLAYGPARCGDDLPAGGADDPAELVTDVDGEEVRVEAAQRPSGLLADLHADECAAAAVRDVVDLRLGDSWERTGPRTSEGEIELALRGAGEDTGSDSDSGGRVTVDQVEGNMIFGLAPIGGDASASDPWLEVSGAEPAARLPVVVSAGRCDPHAVAEYKRTFVFTAWVRLGGDDGDDDPVRVDIAAEGAARRALEDLLTGCLA
jgi:hypothetical protein